LDISVRGLGSGVNKFRFKVIPYGFKQTSIYWESESFDKNKTRQYYLKIYIDWDKFPLAICNMDWVQSEMNELEPAKEDDFIENTKRAYDLIKNVFKKHSKYFNVLTFCGIIPGRTWFARAYIKVITELPITGHDVFVHSNIRNLSEFGLNHLEEIEKKFTSIVRNEVENISEIYTNEEKRHSISRRAENNVRKKHGLKEVGDTFINETILANYIKQYFPDMKRQYNAKWLKRYLIDIYIPSEKVAIEYHGVQHFKGVPRFGGDEKLIKQKARDDFVREQCEKNGVLLLEWPFSLKVTEKSVFEFLSKRINIPEKLNAHTLEQRIINKREILFTTIYHELMAKCEACEGRQCQKGIPCEVEDDWATAILSLDNQANWPKEHMKALGLTAKKKAKKSK